MGGNEGRGEARFFGGSSSRAKLGKRFTKKASLLCSLLIHLRLFKFLVWFEYHPPTILLLCWPAPARNSFVVGRVVPVAFKERVMILLISSTHFDTSTIQLSILLAAFERTCITYVKEATALESEGVKGIQHVDA